ncbi:MAG: redoxin domain-containing protein [Acidobacteria bacterium]|nr:redoxin domain-containing protein [Acidobacteriota bacterium]
MKRVLLSAVALCLLLAAGARAQGEKGGEDVERGRVRAPELEGGRGWLNTDKPLSIAGLRGKVVLLDFWTYGCVNCMHVIPDLKRLEEKYPNELVVIGVHSAKFENEKETENIRRIILRYGLEHPVVNDADFRIWKAYAVHAWPTLVLVDPSGYVVGQVAGEGHFDVLDGAVNELVNEAKKRGTLDTRPVKFALERAKTGDLPLAFPGKVLADERGDRLFVSDSNHNRVVVTKLDGTLLYTVGSGARGRRDGTFDTATFDGPQGLALDGETLYVADTRNHLLRRVDLKARSVETAAGTGAQARDYDFRSGPALTTPLNSPWDLALVGRTLYVAMAGPHQIWKLDLDSREVSVYAGTGREARNDGKRVGEFEDPGAAAFAQPSGLAAAGAQTLYVSDAESNIVRAVSGEEVRTLAGGDLFDFGDRDGEGDEVRLQHPLGLALDAGRLYIADTYNHKLKVLDPRARTVKTFAGTGRPGQADGARPEFYEPGGLSIAGGKLYVADTNNHAVRVLDLKTKQTTTLMLRGLKPPAASAAVADTAGPEEAAPNAEQSKVPAQRLASAGDAALVIEVALPAGYHVNTDAPNRYAVTVEDGAQSLALADADPKSLGKTTKDLRLPVRVPLRAAAAGAARLRVSLRLYYCREDNTGTCRIKTLVWLVPVELTADPAAPREIRLQGKVEAKDEG